MSGLYKRGEIGPKVTAALKELADRHGGVLKAEDVVEAARPEGSPLHHKFDWDDGHAAEQWRYWQARTMILVAVDVIPTKTSNRVARAFVSLSIDRATEGGYRVMTDVLENDTLRDQLLEDSIEHMARFRQRFANLQELGAVFNEMRLVEEKTKKIQSLKPVTVNVDMKA